MARWMKLVRLRVAVKTKPIVILLFPFFLSGLTGCLKGGQPDPIILPPGTQVKYSNEKFLDLSGEFYSVELRKLNSLGRSESLTDLTPRQDKGSPQLIDYVIPKDLNGEGLYIIQATITRANLVLSAFVLPGRVTKPSLTTTFAVNLISNYPGKLVQEFSAQQIIQLEDAIERVIKSRLERYKFPADIRPTSYFRFLQNALASDTDLLGVCDDIGMEFDYTSKGIVASEPYPFGKANFLPRLDVTNSTPTNREVRATEKDELTIRGRALDPENDLVLYRWYSGETLLGVEPQQLRWLPDYDAGRDEPYPFRLLMTDGGPEQEAVWSVKVDNRNRPPEITESCGREIGEWETYRCKITAKDWDNEMISFRVSDKSVNARVLVNGVGTDDSTRTVVVPSVSEVEVEFIPNNLDALNRSAYIEVTAIDASLGETGRPLVLEVRDINSPPSVVGGATQLALGGSNNEWDYCANRDPDGTGPYWFYIKVQDPDNQPTVAPRDQHPDKVSVTFGGTLRAEVVLINEPNDPVNFIPNAITGCPANTPDSSYFCFQWKPTESKKTGTLTVQSKDNHGGMGAIQTVQLVAYDRNVQPCMTSSGAKSVLLYDAVTTGTYQVSAVDDDLDSPTIAFTSIAPQLLPYLTDCRGGSRPVVLRQTAFDPSQFFYRVEPGANDGTNNACMNTQQRTSYSGVVELSRLQTHTESVQIPAGYTFETPFLSGKRLKYELPFGITINPEDLRVQVPVRAIDRTAAVGSMSRFISAPPQADMTVTNGNPLIAGGELSFSRTNTAFPVVIPAGTIVGSNELLGPDVSSIHYQTIEDLVLPVGVGTAVTQGARVNLAAAPGELTVMTGGLLPGPAFSVANPARMEETIGHSLYALNQTGVTNGVDRFCYQFFAEDGATAAPQSIAFFQGPPPQPDLTISHATAIRHRGTVSLNRTNTGLTTLVPAGTILRTANNTKFETVQAIAFLPGTASQSVAVRRRDHLSPLIDQACAGFSDTNYAPSLLTSVGLKAVEGQATLDFKIEVTDNLVDPTVPQDPADRHTFSFSPLGLAPSGQLLFCRDPGSHPSDLSMPACVPCSDTSGDYFRTSKCYVRFLPALDDVGRNYTYSMTVQDNGMTFPAGRNQMSSTLSISVREINDPPQFADPSYSGLVGNSVTNPYNLGSFVENTQSDYFVHAIDPDRTDNLKRLAFNIENQVYDVQTGAWVPTPAGMSVTVVNYNADPYGTTWGSQNRARISWRPNDGDAKRLAGSQGFILKVRAQDGNTDPGPRLVTYGYFKVGVSNINNPPSLKPFAGGNTLTFQADRYTDFASSLVTLDADYSSLGPPVNHTTRLSLCRSSSIFDCTAPLDAWPEEIRSFDNQYNDNSGVPQCRLGSLPDPDLALPRLLRINATPEMENATTLRYRYRIRWCPQKEHIGVHTAYAYINDNGDKDRNGDSRPEQNMVAPLNLKVVAPVYFISPGRDSSGAVVHFMPQAFANVTNYTYPTIVKNSRGNALQYTLISPPTGMTINSQGVISWRPTSAQITNNPDSNTWPLITVRVRDTSTNEMDTVSYRLRVRDPLSPLNQAPVINDFFPSLAVVKVKEKAIQSFQVLASDNNGHPLHYRWYVDGVLIYDEGPNFEYQPGLEAGFIDGDGSGSALKPGQHSIRVEVTDGTAMATKSWTVDVVNSIPYPALVFNLMTAIPGITNLTWGVEVGVPTGSFGSTLNSIVFSGSYTRSGLNRNFIHNVRLSNGLYHSRYTTEALPWPAGRRTERVTHTPPSGSSFNIQVTSQVQRSGPFNQLTDALNVASTLGHTSFNPSHLCSGGCPQNLFFGPDSNGPLPMARYAGPSGRHLFFSNEATTEMLWDLDGGVSQTFFTLPIGLRIGAIAVNEIDLRLYVSARDIGNQVNRIYVFDIAPVNIGQLPALLTPLGLSVFDGVNSDNRILDLVVIAPLRKVYALLPGTGGVAILTDPVSVAPNTSDIEFLGVNEIGSSFSDAVGDGRKLIYNTKQGLIYGVAKDARQVFSIDPLTNELKVQAVITDFDELLFFPNDGLTVAINKTSGQIYTLR